MLRLIVQLDARLCGLSLVDSLAKLADFLHFLARDFIPGENRSTLIALGAGVG